MFFCSLCSRTFTTPASFAMHKRKYHAYHKRGNSSVQNWENIDHTECLPANEYQENTIMPTTHKKNYSPIKVNTDAYITSLRIFSFFESFKDESKPLYASQEKLTEWTIRCSRLITFCLSKSFSSGLCADLYNLTCSLYENEETSNRTILGIPFQEKLLFENDQGRTSIYYK